ncbi:hypothetical protein [Paraburkholderia sp. BCC1885]|uniref:hypothetical protein n=1 Tax=Paraburkholderia sp. BCC1885 TaxID=2562669 RepID=UPI001182F9D0|nr:hypothetical protein [Paraburkholderia sp. BCC1885]
MSIDINVLVDAANKAETAEGFIGCHIKSAGERLLAFHFDDVMNAHVFLAARQALNMYAYMDNERQNVVIVRQP